MGLKKPGPELFADVLKLIQLKLKQLDTMMELVRSLAMEELKRAKAPGGPSMYDVNTQLGKYIPWKMPPANVKSRDRDAWWHGVHRKEFELQSLIGQVKQLRAVFDLIKPEEETPHAERPDDGTSGRPEETGSH